MAMKPMSDGALREALISVELHGDITKAAAALGMARATLQTRVNEARNRKITIPGKRDPLAQAQVTIRELKQRMSAIHAHNESAEVVRQELYGLAAKSPEPPEWTTMKKGKGHHALGSMPFAFWSDWHYGERVSKAETAGINEYNREIGKQRIRRLVERTIVLARGFAFKDDAPKPPGIVVALGGDMISGDIHEELAETNELTPLQCVHELIDILVWAIDQMKAEFGKVFIPCVIGNHGRTTKKQRAKQAVFLSYEWNLYTSLERHYKKDPDVTIFVPGETDAFFKVAGQRFLLTHGNALGVKGGDGIIGALGPIARGAVKLRSSEYKIGREFDYLIMGHWHQEIWLPGVIVNNALKGYDEYARLFLRASPSRPSQCLWFVHPEHGITARISVYVDKQINSNQEKTPWVEIQAPLQNATR